MSDTHGGARSSGGRPRGSKNKFPSKSLQAQQKMAELIEPRLAEIADALFSILFDPIAPHSAKVSAARELLDRSLGKPKEFIDVQTNAEELSVADLLAVSVGG